MKIAIVGSSGYISGYLISRFQHDPGITEIIKIDQNQDADCFLDLQEPENFDYAVLRKVDYVIFTAAISGPDKCAEEFDLCWKINVTGTSYFIRKALEQGCKVLFFSSDAVFGDIPGYIYQEDSQTCAQTPYGKMKKAIEDTFWGDPSFKAIRLSYVASAQDRFVRYCMKCIDNNEEAEVFHPFYRNCIVVSDVVNVVQWMIRNWNMYTPVVLNVAGKELVSRVRIADELNRISGNKLRFRIVAPDERFYQNRPPITQMKSIYMQKYHILEDNSFTEKIKMEMEI